jgi:hypothetical protein
MDPTPGGGMGNSAHRWEEHSEESRSLAIRNLRSQANLQMTQTRVFILPVCLKGY